MAGLYIHIPFCHGKCDYCDFYSLGAPVEGLMKRYVEAVLTEWRLRGGELLSEQLSTVYIGGGTPSSLPLPLLERLVSGLADEGVDFSSLAEFTIEANPEDLGEDWLNSVRRLGVNRISMGVQSFNDRELRAVSRRHSAERAREALRLLSASGLNYSADLIYGLPGQTLADWERNLDTLLAFAPPHFSAYLLSYEPGTPLHARLLRGAVSEASEQLAVDMYSLLCDKCSQAGYRHYEISAFGRPGFEAVHNSSYWDFTPYLGLGCAAHSFSPDGVRRFNQPNIMKYLGELEQGRSAAEIDEETAADRLNDYIITSLRTDTGLNMQFLREKWGEDSLEALKAAAKPFVNSGKLIETDNHIIIPEREWLTADSVLRELII